MRQKYIGFSRTLTTVVMRRIAGQSCLMNRSIWGTNRRHLQWVSTNLRSQPGMRVLVDVHFSVSVKIMVIQEIKEIQQILRLRYSLEMSWVDSRLELYNIKLDTTMNIISIDELNQIWLTTIIFHNTERGQRTINDDESFATINRFKKALSATQQ